MIPEAFADHHFILGSKSPRRQHLLKELGLKFEVANIHVDEVYPANLAGAQIAEYLCELKADAFSFREYPSNSVLITADTIVWLENECIGKPSGKNEAIMMLRKLSGKQHIVFTGICLKKSNKKKIFHVETAVNFKKLSEEEIKFYIDHHRPFDKAGSYGIQDWIGYTAISGISGCYYNVMGFPTQRFWQELSDFI
jgi:septum formation protein